MGAIYTCWNVNIACSIYGVSKVNGLMANKCVACSWAMTYNYLMGVLFFVRVGLNQFL
jgi:hypothetical protein